MSPADRLALLQRACAESSQAAVARRLGKSSAVICGILKGTYKGDTEGVLSRVEEVYGSSSIHCPGLGESIPLARCAVYRKRPWASINHEWIRMFNACRVCPHNQKA